MEQAQLLELASKTVAVISPLVAGGALAQLGEHTTDARQALLRRAWALLQERFKGNAEG